MFSLGDNVTRIESQVSNVFKADAVASEITLSLQNDKVKVTNWKAENAQLLTALNSQGSSSYMIQGFVLVSVVIGIASVLAITVVQKSRQIGILKAMGMRDRDASLVFLIQGLAFGLAGAILGAVAGISLLVMFLEFAKNPDGTPVINIFIDYTFVALSGLVAIVSSIVASMLPARKSARLDPIEVIRNG
jgi:lipoprotein-releasing system permease protein